MKTRPFLSSIFALCSASIAALFFAGCDVTIGSPAPSPLPSPVTSFPLTVDFSVAGHPDDSVPLPSVSYDSAFSDTASDRDGNVYSAGYLGGEGKFDFGNGVRLVTQIYSGVLVKYNSSGRAQWAVCVPGTDFSSVATDSDGNVFVSGSLLVSGISDFGNGVEITLGSNSSTAVLLVKYSPDGHAQWARSNPADTSPNWFEKISVDGAGNIYAIGHVYGTASYDYGNGVTVTPSALDYYSPVIVKYDSGGTAKWAKTVLALQDRDSSYEGVVADAAGNVYAAGRIHDQDDYDFGDGITLTGVSHNQNAVLVKYGSNGTTQWVTSSGGDMFASNTFYDIALDANGNLYAAGIAGSGTVNFGNGVSTTAIGPQATLVKYDANGTAQWAGSVSYLLDTQSLNSSVYNAVAIDSTGKVWVAGSGNSISRYGFGNGVEIETGLARGAHALIARYDSNGKAVAAQSIVSEADDGGTVIYQGSVFHGLTADDSGNVYASGDIGLGRYSFGSGLTAHSNFKGAKPLLVRYH